MIPLADEYVRGLERRYVEKFERVEDLEKCNRELEKLAENLRGDLEVCIRRIKVLEEAVKGPVF